MASGSTFDMYFDEASSSEDYYVYNSSEQTEEAEEVVNELPKGTPLDSLNHDERRQQRGNLTTVT
eukprot:UN18343